MARVAVAAAARVLEEIMAATAGNYGAGGAGGASGGERRPRHHRHQISATSPLKLIARSHLDIPERAGLWRRFCARDIFYFFKIALCLLPNNSARGCFRLADFHSAVLNFNSVQQPPNTKIYRSSAYHFSLFYPDDSFGHRASGAPAARWWCCFRTSYRQGFDIFVTPYNHRK